MVDSKNSDYLQPGDGCFVIWNETVYRQNEGGEYTPLDSDVQRKVLYDLKRSCDPKSFEDIKDLMDQYHSNIENTIPLRPFIPSQVN